MKPFCFSEIFNYCTFIQNGIRFSFFVHLQLVLFKDSANVIPVMIMLKLVILHVRLLKSENKRHLPLKVLSECHTYMSYYKSNLIFRCLYID